MHRRLSFGLSGTLLSQLRHYCAPTSSPSRDLSPEAYRKKLFYQSSYRGMAEMEYILHTFAEKHLESLTDAELKEWQKILDTGDSNLYKWIVQKKEDAVSEELKSQGVSKRLLESLKDIDISNKHVPPGRH
mmetsp:Transcript_24801/g.38641  ORF Transcript_24801/g.38641 Transcript_24801/m.38641 type:complete len:131 (-) Transcript_24801:6-398(-)